MKNKTYSTQIDQVGMVELLGDKEVQWLMRLNNGTRFSGTEIPRILREGCLAQLTGTRRIILDTYARRYELVDQYFDLDSAIEVAKLGKGTISVDIGKMQEKLLKIESLLTRNSCLIENCADLLWSMLWCCESILSGIPVAEIASFFNVSRSTIYRHRKNYRKPGNKQPFLFYLIIECRIEKRDNTFGIAPFYDALRSMYEVVGSNSKKLNTNAKV